MSKDKKMDDFHNSPFEHWNEDWSTIESPLERLKILLETQPIKITKKELKETRWCGDTFATIQLKIKQITIKKNHIEVEVY